MEKIKSFVLNKQNWLFLICLVLLGVIFFLWKGNTEYKDKLKTLQAEDKKKEKMIIEKQKNVKKLEQKVDSLDNKIDNSKIIINNIIKEKDIKLEEVKNLNNYQLQEYFNNRYK